MSWEPISKTLGSVIDERLSSPLISTFVISWSLINYKFFVILFSKESVPKTFDLIEETFWKKKCVIDLPWEYCTPLTQFLILPTIATALYLFVLPRPARWVYEHWRENQKRTNEIRIRYDDEQPISTEESQAYRRRNRELESELETAQRANELQLADLRKAEKELESRVSDAKATAEEAWKSQNEALYADLVETTRDRDHLKNWLDTLRQQRPDLFSEEEEDEPKFSMMDMLGQLKRDGVLLHNISPDMARLMLTFSHFPTADADHLAQATGGISPSKARVLLLELKRYGLVEQQDHAKMPGIPEFSLSPQGKRALDEMRKYRGQFDEDQDPQD